MGLLRLPSHALTLGRVRLYEDRVTVVCVLRDITVCHGMYELSARDIVICSSDFVNRTLRPLHFGGVV